MLELLVAGTLFMAFTIQLGSLWTSVERHNGYLMDRARLLQEARIARALLLADMAGANSTTLGVGNTLLLGYPGLGSPVIQYSSSGGALLRTDTTSAWAMSAARFLETASYTLQADGSLRASLSFRKGAAQVTLNVDLDLPG